MKQKLSFKEGDYILRYYKNGILNKKVEIKQDLVFLKGIQIHYSTRPNNAPIQYDFLNHKKDKNKPYRTSITEMSPIDFFVVNQDEMYKILMEFL